ncbi:MOSC domain-containing protein [Kozakia baliensis]|uniref:MOSC domain-containing protein n=1 Tax=Kozakia baliensis TaxID=153496 RepID=UPI000494FB69|nr:MOSC N-terminal beta barrel domain-containing protein [Kozakia baliensis]
MPHVAALHFYPVKSLHRVSPPSLQLEPWGAVGDRRWLVTAPDGMFLTQRTCPTMATIIPALTGDGITLSRPGMKDLSVRRPAPDAPETTVTVWRRTISAQDAGEEAAAWLSAALGKKLRLVYMNAPQRARPMPFGSVSFADEFPLLVTTTASLDDLNKRLEHAVPMERFRPNIVFDGTLPWAEDDWLRLRIGEVMLNIAKPCSRCNMTMVDQESGKIPVPKEPLRTLATFRHRPGGVMFGRNAVAERMGRVRVGDEVEILETLS